MERKGLELGVGLFLLIGLGCLAYLSFTLGDVPFWGEPRYEVHAVFSNVAGLKEKAPVTMAGVDIGRVESIELSDGQALVTFSIRKEVRLEDDVMASIKTMGIIGDKYVTLLPGVADRYIEPGGMIRDTQPPLDIESLVGRFIFGTMERMDD